MNWHPPLPEYIDDAGTAWRVHKAWHDRKPGEYVLEVLTAGRPGVRGAHLSHGRFDAPARGRPGAAGPPDRTGARGNHLPTGPTCGRSSGRRAGTSRSSGPAAQWSPRNAAPRWTILLDPGAFTAPEMLQSSPDTLVFRALPGPTLGEIGEDHVNVGEKAVCRRVGGLVPRLARPAGRRV